MSDYHGQKTVRPRAEKIRRTRYWVFSTSKCRSSMAKGERRRSNGSGRRSIRLQTVGAQFRLNIKTRQSRRALTGSLGPETNLVNRLPYAVDAAFNSYAKQHSPFCLLNTRVDLLQEISGWADGQDESCIFWLNGLAGSGKSTIARTVASRYFNQKRLGASFFFARGGGDVGYADKFVTSIAVQLASGVPTLRRYISDAVAEHSDITNRSLRTSGSCSSLVRSRSWTATAAVPRMFW
jgi:hypothetical protein